jgi:hypothetical protein
MIVRHPLKWALVAVAALIFESAAAEDYWSYSFHGIDIVAVGYPGSAVELAHHLHRLDGAARQLLLADQSGGERPATHLYAVSPSAFNEMVGGAKDVAMLYQFSGTDNYILLEGSRSFTGENDPYWPAYAGYAGSILLSDGETRYPYWFRQGFAEVLGATEFLGSRVTLGGYLKGRVYSLTSDRLIPVRTLLQLRQGDPEMKAREEIYQAECWLLVHLVLFEGNYRSEFAHYLTLIDEGQGPDEAFAASFKVGYDDLDRMLRSALSGGKIRTAILHISDEKDTEQPRKISAGEANAKLAEFDLRLGRVDAATKRAQSVLTSDASNEIALRVLAKAHAQRQEYAESLSTIDRLSDSTISAAGLADRAELLTAVSRAILAKEAVVSADPAQLRQRATADLQRAVEVAPEDRRAWARLGADIAERRDAVAAQSYFAKAVHVFYQHPRDADLAAALSEVAAATNDYTNAVRFGEAWRVNSIDAGSRDRVAAYLSQLKTAHERNSVAAGNSGHN